MTKEEIIKLGTIFADADGGCVHCVAELIKTFKKKFPEIDLNLIYIGISKHTTFTDKEAINELKKYVDN